MSPSPLISNLFFCFFFVHEHRETTACNPEDSFIILQNPECVFVLGLFGFHARTYSVVTVSHVLVRCVILKSSSTTDRRRYRPGESSCGIPRISSCKTSSRRARGRKSLPVARSGPRIVWVRTWYRVESGITVVRIETWAKRST